MLRQEFVCLLWVIEKGSLEHPNLKFKRAELVTFFCAYITVFWNRN